ncbi:hypothetical protein [Rhodopirellula sp. SWK7]|uniref:hypothetical protein n=1 Tax=Rhodopirellula sp. SWK7 TaxID=595460 RepID=UPI0002BD7273|nr:hypothetical protein [Rhodopirellula sp. SWK7]EMI41030.1 hypothetical protein RRSWK_06428 [Rhodopirellula sp. SWK7]
MANTSTHNAANRVSRTSVASRQTPASNFASRVNPILFVCVFLAMPVLALMGGCRLCADCDLESYPSYGGAWQRTLRDSGRVGSIFDPGGSRASDLSARIDSDAADERYRDRIGGTEGDDEPDGDEPEADDAETPEEPERDLELDDRDMQEMQDRFRNLELQDIDYEETGESQQGWQ